MDPFEQVVGSEQELQGIVGTPSSQAVLKVRAALDEHCRTFIGLSPFILIATSDKDGRCDVSPKGDAPGFVRVLDDHRLAIPDRPGNRRLDGMRNLLDNPHVGLLFFVPGREETLRVNGRAWITRDPRVLGLCVAHGKTPLLALGVEVEESFLHCAKAFRRSRLWSSDTWPAPDALPSMACTLFEQIKPTGMTVSDYEREIEEAYRKLY
jgi:PPOX class probable FMN-dependent enzyme